MESGYEEVEDVMITLYTQEELTESYGALKRQEGRKEGLQKSISNLMESLGFSFEKALDVLGIPAEERKLYHP